MCVQDKTLTVQKQGWYYHKHKVSYVYLRYGRTNSVCHISMWWLDNSRCTLQGIPTQLCPAANPNDRYSACSSRCLFDTSTACLAYMSHPHHPL